MMSAAARLPASRWCRSAVLCLAGLLAAGPAAANLYQESLERSDWVRVEVDDLCRLEQQVRHGGTLQFETRPGLAVRAFWDPPYPMPRGAQVPLETGAPEWLAGDGPAALSLTLRAGPDERFRVPDDQVQALKARLQAGHDVRIGFPDSDEIVHFRGIRFGRRVEGFRHCQAGRADPQVIAGLGPQGGPEGDRARERWVVYFDSGHVRPDGEARSTLQRAVETLAEIDGPQLRVVGFTDAEGTDRVNQRISRQRAEAVREALVDAGLSGADIEVEGVGVAPGVDGESRDARRVEIWWVGERGAAAPEDDRTGAPPVAPQPVEPGDGTGW